MANVPVAISALAAASVVELTDVLPIVEGGSTFKLTLAQLLAGGLPVLGLVGNNSNMATANAAAINAALAAVGAAGGGVVAVPPGTYWINTTLVIYSGTKLVLAPATTLLACMPAGSPIITNWAAQNSLATLAANITATNSTTTTVVNPSRLPATPFTCRVDNEWFNATNLNGTTLTLTRGYFSSTASTHTSGTRIAALSSTAPDHDITIEGGVIDGQGTNTNGANGIVLQNAQHIKIRDMRLQNIDRYSIAPCNVQDVRIENVGIIGTSQSYCSSIQFHGPASDISIRGGKLLGTTDNVLAFTTTDYWFADFSGGGNITNVLVDNVDVSGCYQPFRLTGASLPGANFKNDRVTIRNITGANPINGFLTVLTDPICGPGATMWDHLTITDVHVGPPTGTNNNNIIVQGIGGRVAISDCDTSLDIGSTDGAIAALQVRGLEVAPSSTYAITLRGEIDAISLSDIHGTAGSGLIHIASGATLGPVAISHVNQNCDGIRADAACTITLTDCIQTGGSNVVASTANTTVILNGVLVLNSVNVPFAINANATSMRIEGNPDIVRTGGQTAYLYSDYGGWGGGSSRFSINVPRMTLTWNNIFSDGYLGSPQAWDQIMTTTTGTNSGFTAAGPKIYNGNTSAWQALTTGS